MSLRRKIFLLGFIAILGVGYALMRQYAQQTDEQRAMDALLHNIEAVAALSATVHELQRERGLTTFALAGARPPAPLPEDLARTDAAIARLSKTGSLPPDFVAVLGRLRHTVATENPAPLVVRDDFSTLLRALVDEMGRRVRGANTLIAQENLYAHVHLVALKEHLGQVRATLAYWISVPQDDGRRARDSLIRIQALFDEERRRFGLVAPAAVREAFFQHFSGTAVTATLNALQVAMDTGHLPSKLDAQTWLNMSTEAIDRLFEMEKHSLRLIEEKVTWHLAGLRNQMNLGLVATLLVTLVVLALTISAIISLLRAIDEILMGMERIAETRDFRRRIPNGSKDELGRIAHSFNYLLEVVENLVLEKERLAATDPLTGISNRLRFAQVLAEEAQRKHRNKTPMALIIFDIDHFKQVNDIYGHHTGDEVLKHFAGLVKTEVRTTDFFARWGGEEFILLLRDDSCSAASALAEKLRVRIAGSHFFAVGPLTCSFGVTAWEAGDTADSLVSRADQALYVSKSKGRNRVTCDCTLKADAAS